MWKTRTYFSDNDGYTTCYLMLAISRKTAGKNAAVRHKKLTNFKSFAVKKTHNHNFFPSTMCHVERVETLDCYQDMCLVANSGKRKISLHQINSTVARSTITFTI